MVPSKARRRWQVKPYKMMEACDCGVVPACCAGAAGACDAVHIYTAVEGRRALAAAPRASWVSYRAVVSYSLVSAWRKS